MNVIISVITLKFIFEYLNSLEIRLSTRIRFFTYFGLLSPLGDYIIRFWSKVPLTQSYPVYFQSLIYHFSFWSFIVLLNWITFRDLKRSVRYYAPVAGLALYSLFSLLSTSKIPLLYPFIKQGYSFNLVNSGYLFPVVVLSVIWIVKNTAIRKPKLMNGVALSFMALFLLFAMGIKGAMKSDLPEPFNKSEVINIRPIDHFQFKWVVISEFKDRYYHTGYQFFKGWDKEIRSQFKYHDIDLLQNLLLNPKIRTLYFNVFNNPVLRVDFQRENLFLEITEPVPSFDMFWLQSVRIVLNSSGQIITCQTSYRFLNWRSVTFNI